MASEPVGIAQNKKRKSLKIKDLRFLGTLKTTCSRTSSWKTLVGYTG